MAEDGVTYAFRINPLLPQRLEIILPKSIVAYLAEHFDFDIFACETSGCRAKRGVSEVKRSEELHIQTSQRPDDSSGHACEFFL